jgi:hypothetical protein
MSAPDRKASLRAYKETPRPAGVFRIRHNALCKSLVGTSVNLPAILNRHRFQLTNGSHPDLPLQRDWNECGPAAFAFEVLDELTPKKEPDYEPAGDLAVLLDMWLQKLAATGEAFYGPPQPRA